MDKQDIQHWTGEGLPPVGTACEVKSESAIPFSFDWEKCEISALNTGSDGKQQICTIDKNGDFAIYYPDVDKVTFRPIRTPEQIEAERRSKVIASLSQLIVNKCHSDVAALDIYDAIRAGKIEGVKIDG